VPQGSSCRTIVPLTAAAASTRTARQPSCLPFSLLLSVSTGRAKKLCLCHHLNNGQLLYCCEHGAANFMQNETSKVLLPGREVNCGLKGRFSSLNATLRSCSNLEISRVSFQSFFVSVAVNRVKKDETFQNCFAWQYQAVS
jgi:hypothetical protein